MARPAAVAGGGAVQPTSSADSQLLPLESIRFFYLDRAWTDALIQGALCVGTVNDGGPGPAGDRLPAGSATRSTRRSGGSGCPAARAAGGRRPARSPASCCARALVSGLARLHVRAYASDLLRRRRAHHRASPTRPAEGAADGAAGARPCSWCSSTASRPSSTSRSPARACSSACGWRPLPAGRRSQRRVPVPRRDDGQLMWRRRRAPATRSVRRAVPRAVRRAWWTCTGWRAVRREEGPAEGRRRRWTAPSWPCR